MIGSKNKVRITRENLLKEGYTKEQLDEVHAPIGIPLGGQLPEDKEELPYRICLRGQKEKPEIFYLHNGKRVDCRVTGREDAWEAAGTVRLTEEAYQWIRFGAEAKDGGFLFYGNAITRGTGKQKLRTFGEAVKQL